MVICALLGFGLILGIITLDAPVFFGLVHGDSPNPDQPGHLKGVTVSTFELFAKVTAAAALLTTTAWLWRSLRKADRELPAG